MVDHVADDGFSVELVIGHYQLLEHLVIPESEDDRVEPFGLERVVRKVKLNPEGVGAQNARELEGSLA